MSTPDASTTDPALQDGTVTQTGSSPTASHVPEPPSGVRGADQVDDMDAEPGEGTTTGADGSTAAREALREGLGERSGEAGTEDSAAGGLEQTAALGATDDPEGGSVQRDGS